jgi:hypothetical protein
MVQMVVLLLQREGSGCTVVGAGASNDDSAVLLFSKDGVEGSARAREFEASYTGCPLRLKQQCFLQLCIMLPLS